MHISPPTIGTTPASLDEEGLGLALVRTRRKRRRIAWAAIAVAAVAAIGVFALQSSQPPLVATETAAMTPVERVLAVTGRVRAKESVAVLPRIAGQVVELFKNDGDMVAAGDILGRIDDARAKSAVEQADAALEAQSRILAQAERDLGRSSTLRARGTSTDAAVEATTLAVTRGREELRRLKAAADDSRLRLAEYAIVAPLDGRVLDRPIDPGQVVDARTILFEIAPVSDREVETEVDEAYSMALSLGQPARMAFAGVAEPITGSVTYLSPQIDASTGGRVVRLTFEPPAPGAAATEIPVGLSADVNIVVERDPSALTVARAAIRDAARAPYVMVVDGDRVARREIGFRDWPADRVIVTEGLGPGDRVILDAVPPPVGTVVTLQRN